MVPLFTAQHVYEAVSPTRAVDAVRDAFVAGRVIGVHLGEVHTPDSVAQTADFLLTLEKMEWSVVTARYAGRLHVSLRANDPGAGAGSGIEARAPSISTGAGGGGAGLAAWASTFRVCVRKKSG